MRFYKDSNNDLIPSVTTVLDATGDKSGITQWRRKVGTAQADAIVQESTLIGSAVHEAIENYLLGKSWNGTIWSIRLHLLHGLHWPQL